MELLYALLTINNVVFYIAAGYIALLLLLYFLQERFIFKPEKLPKDFVYKYDVPFKELFFDVATGVTINGLHFYCKKPHGLILYLHGNTRSIKGWAKYARDFYRYNYDVVMVDYRGFGKSTGKRSERDIKQDLQFVYDTLAVQYHEHHILVYGRSLGSGFATKLAADNKPRYLIIDSPYFSFKKVAERFLPFLPHQYVLRYHLRTDKWITRVNCHTYIIHGTKDWLIPISHSERLRALNPNKITLITIHGGGHNNLPSFPEYHNFIRDILRY
ncbi:alpha/beta fold hydrolase [Panacibacter sp. DH6]|uniref:Alpha/beta fold hydrolase n=1 Tax=Panacibacter microcysteis TaxID=2793269 RepID=A0A931E7V5_9BACT|nr:alpha/beta fold hydrolase [Panacibacter microcysteis]MBG9376718.1 alpha/beta fold hydrolase [Panacibacter microcysteis]